MIPQIPNINDISKNEVQNFLSNFVNLNSRVPLRICFVFEIRTGNIIGVWNIKTVDTPNEIELKVLKIKGQRLDDFINRNMNLNAQSDLNLTRDLEIIPTEVVGFSENAFGYIVYGGL